SKMSGPELNSRSRAHSIGPGIAAALLVTAAVLILRPASPTAVTYAQADSCELSSDEGCVLEFGPEIAAELEDASVQHVWRLDVTDEPQFRIHLAGVPYRL